MNGWVMTSITCYQKRLRRWVGVWLLPLLSLTVMQPPVLASDLDAAPEHLMIQNILKNAGVTDIIYQLPDWVEQEMDHLVATPIPFAGSELQSVRQDMEATFSSASLKERLRKRLASQFTLEELTALNDIFKQPDVKQFQDLQEGTQSDYIKADIRSYKAKLKNLAPRGSRVDMVRSLEENLKQSDLERDLKVELRKSLLTSVSWVKSNEKLEESLLDKELASYRKKVGEEINRNTLIFYLYLFKRTPSEKLGELVSLFNDPNYNRFMNLCHEEVLAAVQESRRRIPDDMKLAGSQ